MIGAAARQPTKTELAAHERRVAFRQSIAEKAAALKEKREGAHQPRDAAPEAVAAQPDPPAAEVIAVEFPPLALPPMKAPMWFSIAGVTAPAPLRVSEIQAVVCAACRVELNDLVSARRTANVVHPRHVAMYLSKMLTGRSLPEIGRRFGGRDHTTVLHAVRKITAKIEVDPELSEFVNALRADIEARRGE